MSARSKNVRYLIELGGALLIYAASLLTSIRLAAALPQGPRRDSIAVLPVVGVLLVIWAIVRQVRRVDEYVRKTMLEQLGIAAAVTAGWTFSYGFLEAAGFPRLSMFTVWPVMGAVWGILACVHAVHNR
jgi:hypothetical protein